MDLIWLKGNPLLHIIDTQTHYQKVIILKGGWIQDIWNPFVEGWASVYLGYPNREKADSRSVLTSNYFDEVTKLDCIEVVLSGVESHNSL